VKDWATVKSSALPNLHDIDPSDKVYSIRVETYLDASMLLQQSRFADRLFSQEGEPVHLKLAEYPAEITPLHDVLWGHLVEVCDQELAASSPEPQGSRDDVKELADLVIRNMSKTALVECKQDVSHSQELVDSLEGVARGACRFLYGARWEPEQVLGLVVPPTDEADAGRRLWRSLLGNDWEASARSALKALPEDEANALLGWYLGQLSHGEIAQRMKLKGALAAWNLERRATKSYKRELVHVAPV